MKNVFDRLSPTLQLILAQCANLGLDLAALMADGTSGLTSRFSQMGAEFKAAGIDLKAVLNGDYSSLKKPGDVSAAVEDATKELQTQLATAKSEAQAAQTKVTAFETAATKFGAVLKADDKGSLSAEAIEKAFNDRASVKAAEQLNKHGLPAALALTPSADPTKARNDKAKTREEFFALSPAARLTFSRAGGKITDAV